jgi:hypothetical protein
LHRLCHRADREFNVSGTKARIGGSVISNPGGIDAVSGVTDLGGNTASGNGNPLQRQNVFCS